MKCSHCLVSFHDSPTTVELGQDKDGYWFALYEQCPACGHNLISLQHRRLTQVGWKVIKSFLAYPRALSRPPLDPAVTKEFAADYNEACRTLTDSPKASAALSRRCLQHVLREKGGVKNGNLYDEIQQIIDSGKIPSHVTESLDAVRHIGNFAAHPMKSTATGEIIDVEPGEAEWNLDVLESLFDFYFVQPELIKKKRAALDAKLKEAGKPPLK